MDLIKNLPLDAESLETISPVLYLLAMLAVICIWFVLLKRPIWEAMGISFLVLVAITGTWSKIGAYIEEGLTTKLLYSMIVFVCMSAIMTKTKILDGAVNLILAFLGYLARQKLIRVRLHYRKLQAVEGIKTDIREVAVWV